jgi:hypothetical protein
VYGTTCIKDWSQYVSTQFIHVYRMIITLKTDYFLKQQWSVGYYKGGVLFPLRMEQNFAHFYARLPSNRFLHQNVPLPWGQYCTKCRRVAFAEATERAALHISARLADKERTGWTKRSRSYRHALFSTGVLRRIFGCKETCAVTRPPQFARRVLAGTKPSWPFRGVY